MKQANFSIEGMHCEACARTVRGLLETEPGVKQAEVSFDTAKARVLFDPEAVSETRLKTKIAAAGYRIVGFAENPEQARR